MKQTIEKSCSKSCRAEQGLPPALEFQPNFSPTLKVSVSWLLSPWSPHNNNMSKLPPDATTSPHSRQHETRRPPVMSSCLLQTHGVTILNPAQVEHIVRWYSFTLCETIQSGRRLCPPAVQRHPSVLSKTAAPPLLPTLQCSQLGRSPSSSRLHFNWIFNTPNHPRSGQDRV